MNKVKAKFPDLDIVKQTSPGIDHVKGVQCLAISAVSADMLKGFLHCPVCLDRNEIRSHKSSNTVFSIAELSGRLVAAFGRQQGEHAVRFFGRQIL